MNRKSFFKSLFGLAIAPKLISEINWETLAKTSKPTTNNLLSDLIELTPKYYEQYVKKYGNESYSLMNDFLKSE